MISGVLDPICSLKAPVFSRVFVGIPSSTEQGILKSEQGIISAEQGIRSAEHSVALNEGYPQAIEIINKSGRIKY